MLARASQCSATLCWVRGEGEGGQEESIALDGVVAQSTGVHSYEGTLACALSTQSRQKEVGYCREVKAGTCLEDLEISFEDDLYGQWGNSNIDQL